MPTVRSRACCTPATCLLYTSTPAVACPQPCCTPAPVCCPPRHTCLLGVLFAHKHKRSCCAGTVLHVRLPYFSPAVVKCHTLTAWHSTGRIGSDLAADKCRTVAGSGETVSSRQYELMGIQFASRQDHLTKAGSLSPGTQLFPRAVPLADADRLHPSTVVCCNPVRPESRPLGLQLLVTPGTGPAVYRYLHFDQRIRRPWKPNCETSAKN